MSSSGKADLPGPRQPAIDPPAILALPLELREEIFALALQDIIIAGPEHPYDDYVLSEFCTLGERFQPLADLRSVSRQFCHEVDQVCRRDIAPRTIFYVFSKDDIARLCQVWGTVFRHPAWTREARFYLRSPDKEAICANDDADMIWDTLIESQAGCERVSYEEDPQVMAGWALDPASAPENVTVSSPPRGRWGYRLSHSGEVRTFCEWATILYEPLAKSLRLKSIAWCHDFWEGDTLDGLAVCSILEGKLKDLDFDAFDELAGRKYKTQAYDFVPAQFWSLYGWADVERKRALRDELIDVGADWVVESQKQCEAVDEEALSKYQRFD